MLWIAALAGVAAATVLVVLISHSGKHVPVTPLREEKASAKPRSSDRDGAQTDNGWLLAPAPGPNDTGSRQAGTGGSRVPAEPGGRNAAIVQKHEGIHPVQSTSARVHLPPVGPGAPVAIPVAPPASAPSTDSHSDQPVQVEQVPKPSTVPVGSAPEPNDVDIEIRHGAIITAPAQLDPKGRSVTLLVRSDELTIVDIDDVEPDVTALAGTETPITLDAHLARHLEIKLTRRAGVLNLRLED